MLFSIETLIWCILMFEAMTSVFATFAITTWATLTTFRTWTTLAFYVAFGLRQERTTREFVLPGLGIDFQKLHAQLVTFLDSGVFNSIEALPINL